MLGIGVPSYRRIERPNLISDFLEYLVEMCYTTYRSFVKAKGL